MEYRKCELFWIDQENIIQDDNREKEVAMQSMDFVYSLSDFPVGLLSVQIESGEQMYLLISLLRGDLVEDEEDPEFDRSVKNAPEALELLRLITSDRWWTRAWTFREDYRSSTKITLLIPHYHHLEDQKRHASDVLGNLPGEICIKSADFRKEATKFCITYRRRYGQQNEQICIDILGRAGKYTVLLREIDKNGDDAVSKPMSPTIFADIGSRGVADFSDYLSVRLDTKALKTTDCSLSLSMFALYLLNGEIIMNNRENDETSLDGNIFNYLKKNALNNFLPPVWNELTFIKSCRFLNVRLSRDGIETVGHLWRLGETITGRFSKNLPYEQDSHSGLNRYQRRRLKQLLWLLKSRKFVARCELLAASIDSFLKDDMVQKSVTFSKQYKNVMANEIVEAMKVGKKLCLAYLVQGPHQPLDTSRDRYRGLFVSKEDLEEPGKECKGESGGRPGGEPSYVFTASQPAGNSPRDIDKHVSLEVELQGLTDRSQPRLITTRWINGLYFFDGCPRQNVVFPWPYSLR
jgi:Heterokaryon incompatibility protein (HET)